MQDGKLLAPAEGGARVTGPETVPRAALRPFVLREDILNPP